MHIAIEKQPVNRSNLYCASMEELGDKTAADSCWFSSLRPKMQRDIVSLKEYSKMGSAGSYY